jgi:hypothetical protein
MIYDTKKNEKNLYIWDIIGKMGVISRQSTVGSAFHVDKS